MRRAFATLLLTLTTLALTVPAAVAAETSGPESDAFGAGQWDGMLLAFILGIAGGVIVFLTIGGGPAPDAHGEEAPHGADHA